MPKPLSGPALPAISHGRAGRPHRVPGRERSATGPLAAAISVYGVTMAFQGTSLSLFLADAVHAAPLLIGLFFTVRAAAGIVVNQGAGWLSDRVRDRRVILGVAGLSGVCGALSFAFVRSYPLALLAGTVFLSIGAVTFGQLFAYANVYAGSSGRDVTSFSAAMRAIFSAAWVVGPPLGLFLLAGLGFRSFYLIVAVLAAGCAVLGRWGLPPVTAPARGQEVPRRHPRRARSGRRVPALPPRLWLLIAVVLLLGIVNQMYGIDIPLHVTKDTGHGAQLVGWMAGVTAAAEIPVMIVAGRLARRAGRGRIVGAAAAGAALFYCALPFAASTPALLAMAALNGLFQGVSLSLPMVMVQDEAPGGPGSASALYSSAFGAAGMLAGAATGAVTAVVGYGNLFWLCAVLCGCAALLMVIRSRWHASRPLRVEFATGQPV